MLVGNLVARLKLETVQFEQGINKVTNSLTRTGAAMNRLGTDMTRAVTLPLVAAGAAALKFGTEFEDAFTGVKKTVEGTPEQLSKLSEEFKKLSTEIPVSATGLSRIGEIAGQLGIPIDKIMEFTQVIAEMGDATVLSTEEAATGMAQFIASTGGTADMARDLGNVLVDLGNNFATNEAIILDFAKQMGGTAAGMGVTQEKVLALSAVLANVGISAERGASAMTRVFVEMDKAIAMNTENLQVFAQVAGQSTEEFARSFREDAAKAVASFVIGLNRTQELGGSVSVVLDTLKLDGLRVADSLRRVSMSTDAMNDAFARAEEQWEGGTALADEVAKRYETISSQLKILKNNFELAFIEVFEAVRPILKDQVIPLLRDLVEWIKQAAQWFKNLEPATQKMILKWTALAALAGPVLTFVSKFVFALKNILTLLPGVVKGLGLLASAFVDLQLFKAVKSFGDLQAAMSLSLESSALLRGGLIGLAVALAGLGTYKAIEGIRRLTDESLTLHDVISEQPSLWDGVLKAMNPIQAGIEEIYRTWRKLSLAWKAWSEGGMQGLWAAMKGMSESTVEASASVTNMRLEVGKLASSHGQAAAIVTKLAASHGKAAVEIQKVAAIAPPAAIRISSLGNEAEKTAIKADGLAMSMKAVNAAIAEQNEVMTPYLFMLQDMGVLEAKATRQSIAFSEAVDGLKFSFEDAGYSFTEGTYKLQDWKVELDSTSDVIAATNRSIDAWAKKQEEATKRGADFAKQWNNAWSTAMGNVVGRWMDGLLEMKFSFNEFSSNILSSLKDLGKTMLKLIIGEIFKPILGAANAFGQNLAKQIGSWLFGGKGPEGGLFGGVFDMLGGKGGGGLFGKIGGLFSKGTGSAASTGAGAAGGGSSMMASLAGFFTNPLTIGVGAAIASGLLLWKQFFKKDAFKSGIAEIQRDFHVAVSQGTLDGFISAIGISKQQFEPFRKSITGSPKAFEDILLPAAKATNSVNELIQSFGRFSVSGAFKDILQGSGLKYTKSGNNFIVDLSVQAQQAVEGNFAALNDAFLQLFGDSGLADAFGDLSRFLSTTVSDLTEDLADTGEALSESAQEMRRATDRAIGRLDGTENGRRDVGRPGGRGGTSGTQAGDMFGFNSDESWVERQQRLYGNLGSPGNRPQANDGLPGVNIFDVLDMGYPGWDVGSFQQGGVIPRTGYAFVHQGEEVIPAGGGGVNLTQNVTVIIKSPSEDLARVTKEVVIPAFRRELQIGSTGLRGDIVRVVVKNNQGVNSN